MLLQNQGPLFYLCTKILPKLRTGSEIRIGVDFSVTAPSDIADNLERDLLQILEDLNLSDKVRVE